MSSATSMAILYADDEPTALTALAERLRAINEGADKGDMVLMIHLFGIRYAGALRDCGASLRGIVLASGVSTSYQVELNKAVRLAQYVQLRVAGDRNGKA